MYQSTELEALRQGSAMYGGMGAKPARPQGYLPRLEGEGQGENESQTRPTGRQQRQGGEEKVQTHPYGVQALQGEGGSTNFKPNNDPYGVRAPPQTAPYGDKALTQRPQN